MAAISIKFLDKLLHQERKEIEGLISQMNKARKEYKQAVRKFYQRKPLFAENRDSNQREFEVDLEHYDELIEHCLRVGDAGLLYELGIEPIVNPLGKARLAYSQNISLYITAFEEYIDDSEDDFERLCWTILRDKFQNLMDQNSLENLKQL